MKGSPENDERPGSWGARQSVFESTRLARFVDTHLRRLRQAVRRFWHGVTFRWLASDRDEGVDPLVEFWLRFDANPPRPSEFAAARAIFAPSFIARVIADRAELGPRGLDVLLVDLVGELARRATWESMPPAVPDSRFLDRKAPRVR